MAKTRFGKGRRILLEVSGITADQRTIIGGFKSMSGMDSETEIVEVKDEKGAIHKQPGRTTYSNISLGRGQTATDDLWKWRKKIEDGIADSRSGSIIILDQDGQTEIARYNFYEGWPCKWELDSDQSAREVDRIELAVERIERV